MCVGVYLLDLLMLIYLDDNQHETQLTTLAYRDPSFEGSVIDGSRIHTPFSIEQSSWYTSEVLSSLCPEEFLPQTPQVRLSPSAEQPSLQIHQALTSLHTLHQSQTGFAFPNHVVGRWAFFSQEID